MTAAAEPTRICTRCGATPTGTSRTCPECGARVVEIRAPEDALLGKVIDDRFEVRSVLGQGGMGTVYRAHQRSVDREVALKVIDPRLARDLTAVRRFLREAKLASQLSQPNTVSVFDFGQSDDGYLYLVMELLDGRTLGTVMREDGAFDLARAVRVGVQLCDALEAAHKLGIIHRDLKPANVMVLRDPPGRDLIKVLDFGLAKSVLEVSQDITESGHVVGTPRYLAPEQLAGRAPDRTVDLYAVGVILAEITIARPLFIADGLGGLLLEKRDPPPLPAIVPPELRPILMRLLEPEPARRLGDAAQLRDELAAIDVGRTYTPRTAPVVAARAADDATPATELMLEHAQPSETQVSVASVSMPTVTAAPVAVAADPAARRTPWVAIAVALVLTGAGGAYLVTRGPARARVGAAGPGDAAEAAIAPLPIAAAAEPVAIEPPPDAAAPAVPTTPAVAKPGTGKRPARPARPTPPPPDRPPPPPPAGDPCKKTPRPPECPPF